jgi:ribosomal protein L3 glutamine methyltransferase
MHTLGNDVITTLVSIRDYIRWGASRFAEQNIFLGHGTLSPLDEAAALVLHTLHQPYDLTEQYLDARLTLAERQKLLDIISRRISERKPSAYFTHEALFAGLSFYVDERVLVPRSPIAELIADRFQPWVEESQISHILDLCTGSGCIAIACAYAFPDAQIDASDISVDALAVAAINVKKHDLPDLQLFASDLFDNLPCQSYDIIISNPPYVNQAEWENLPAEYHAEPALGFQGGANGLDLVLRILAEAGNFLAESGILIVETGSSSETLQQMFPNVPFYWLEFEHGGDGVFLLTAAQLKEFHSLFVASIQPCPEIL